MAADLSHKAEATHHGRRDVSLPSRRLGPREEDALPGPPLHPQTRWSYHILAAVDGERRTGDETGFLGREKHDAAGDFLRFAKPVHRNERQDRFL